MFYRFRRYTMPTTKLKNTLYRIALPFFAPNCPRHPVISVSGRSPVFVSDLESLLRKHHVLGSAILITSQKQYSLICTSSENPKHTACPETLFRVASITKLAVSVLCARLMEEGTLDPDRPVNQYFTIDPARSSLEGITLRHLLSHTSGIIDPPGLESAVIHDIPFTELLPSARRFQPGSSFHYSNLGFGLIGCILESVLCLPVGQIFRKCLFDPLQMNASLEACHLPVDMIMPVTRVLPYKKNHDTIVTSLGTRSLLSPDPLRHYGHTAGSMYTDILSLQKLLNVLSRKETEYLSYRWKNEIMSKHASYGPLSPTLSYGLGLLRISDPVLSDGLIYGHQGFAYGCVDGAFWEDTTGRSLIILNGGAGEARIGRLGLLNRDILRWAFRKELPSW